MNFGFCGSRKYLEKMLLLLPINEYQCLIGCGLLIGSHGPQPSISVSLELKPGSWTTQVQTLFISAETETLGRKRNSSGLLCLQRKCSVIMLSNCIKAEKNPAALASKVTSEVG